MDTEIKDIKAFTLVEILVAIVVLAVALVPLIGVFTGGIKGEGVAQKIMIANNLAQDLMEEIKSKKFDEDPTNPTPPGQLGPDPSEQRDRQPPRDFDDVDDYNGYNDSPPQEVDGTIMSDFEGYSRSVVVEYVDENDFNIPVSQITGFKRITVNVIWDDGNQNIILMTVKGNY